MSLEDRKGGEGSGNFGHGGRPGEVGGSITESQFIKNTNPLKKKLMIGDVVGYHNGEKVLWGNVEPHEDVLNPDRENIIVKIGDKKYKIPVNKLCMPKDVIPLKDFKSYYREPAVQQAGDPLEFIVIVEAIADIDDPVLLKTIVEQMNYWAIDTWNEILGDTPVDSGKLKRNGDIKLAEVDDPSIHFIFNTNYANAEHDGHVIVSHGKESGFYDGDPWIENILDEAVPKLESNIETTIETYERNFGNTQAPGTKPKKSNVEYEFVD